jgi:hypothetical protein
MAGARSYRERIRQYASLGYLDVCYARIDADVTVEQMGAIKPVEAAVAKAAGQTHDGTLHKLAARQPDGFRIVNDPPLVSHATGNLAARLDEVLTRYRLTLPHDRRLVLERYRVADMARKVVGVGSVGLRCFIVLLVGQDDDPLFLQLKEARASALEAVLPKSRYTHQGRRVVTGQRIMQAASDMLLGWTRCGTTDYYVRQFRDMKFSLPLDKLDWLALASYAELCGWALARAHACSADAAAIGGYLGKRAIVDRALAQFALAYADQVERDHAALVAAVKHGDVPAETGV